MAKRYIIDDVRPHTWVVRMRDRETGEAVEVPIELGALWPGKLRGDAVPRDRSEPSQPKDDSQASDLPRTSDPAPTEPDAEPTEEPTNHPHDDPKALPRVTEPEALHEVMSSPTLRNVDVDPETVSAEDAAALQKMQTMMRRARGKRAGKRGELGWDETTDAGRSGIIARFGKGAFKILHASGDTYALFYEWDDGRYDRLGCGAAEDLMNIANERARASEPMEPPPSHLSLEVARLYCGTSAQKASALERLEPVLAETDRPASKRAASRSKPAVPTTPPADPATPNEELDQRLTESLKRALAALDARETPAPDAED